jgi:thiamine transporter ThiT
VFVLLSKFTRIKLADKEQNTKKKEKKVIVFKVLLATFLSCKLHYVWYGISWLYFFRGFHMPELRG